MNLDRFGFKAISKSTGTWAFAYLETSFFGCFGVRWNLSETEEYPDCHIEPETLCQCTGLRDSDGNLIYENDYFEIIDSGHVTGRYLVQYHPKSMHFQIKNAYIDTDFSDLSFVPMWMEYGRKVRIIGNKWDNK